VVLEYIQGIGYITSHGPMSAPLKSLFCDSTCSASKPYHFSGRLGLSYWDQLVIALPPVNVNTCTQDCLEGESLS
jgi:hypothetical protein